MRRIIFAWTVSITWHTVHGVQQDSSNNTILSQQERSILVAVKSNQMRLLKNLVLNWTLLHTAQCLIPPIYRVANKLYLFMILKQVIFITKQQSHKMDATVYWTLFCVYSSDRQMMMTRWLWRQQVEDCTSSYTERVCDTQNSAVFHWSRNDATWSQISRKTEPANLKIIWESHWEWWMSQLS